ncbi:MAG: M20/M25/M40 family metallo-hydrolase [Blastocatellia bacterium]|nr:M20/M25/M40 family metallo-hydrolase [Blastocatellia bacterium]
MKKIISFLFLLILVSVVIGQSREAISNELRDAHNAWFSGNYSVALQAYLRLLKTPDGEQQVESIAIQTGELYHTDELTTDARSQRLSADGRLISYETGSPKTPTTRIVETAGTHKLIAELSGTGAVLSPSSKRVAYLKLRPNEELNKAQTTLDNAQGPARLSAQQTVSYLQTKHAVIAVRELATQQEQELNTADLLKTSLVFGPDDQTVYFVGGRDGDVKRNDIYAVTTSSQPIVVTEAEGFKAAPIVAASGKAMLVLLPSSNPLGRASSSQTTPRGQTIGPFGIVDLATKKMQIINGQFPALSADGSAITYLTRNQQETQLMVIPTLSGEATTVLKTTDLLQTPTFAPDNQRLIYARRSNEDYETFIIGRDGKNEMRLTREIQHNALPRFLTANRVLDVIGEPRHRRAWLYDLQSGQKHQLFHNNTVRTISPEYDWQVSADGTKVLIQADRDGDTVSPERGLYLVSVDRKVTKEELIARLEKNLAAELALQAEGKRIFAPIANEVQRVVAQASVNRVYEYQKSLFDFDSKHITRPGNQKAIDYLYETYKSFGYEPVKQCFDLRNAVGGKTCNVYATLRGTEHPELIYVVGSHFDSVAVGPGADDDSSGTAALLEAARVLAKSPQPATIIFISYTGEEAGLLGSREFVRQAQANKMKIVGVLNNDMIGWANDHRLDNTIRYSNSGIRDIEHAAAMQFTKLITYDARWHRGTDATAYFEVYGDIIGGIGSYPVLGNPHYHQATDLLEGINHQLVTETSKTTTATLMMLASSPSPVKDLKVVSFDGRVAELTWTASPEKNVKQYIVAYGTDEKQLKQIRVTTPHVILKDAKPGMAVKVKAVGARKMEGWDWASIKLSASTTPQP